MFGRDSIIDTSEILKDNQALVINAKNNEINYILEMKPNGEITKIYLSKEQKENLKKELNIKTYSNIKAAQSLKNASPKPAKNTHSNTQTPTSSHIKQWNKSQIIYEQEVERLNR